MATQKDIAKQITSAADFEQILQISYANKGVSVLDIYSSEWGPCKAISETFRRLYTEAGEAVHLRFFTVECNAVLESLRTEDPAIARHNRPKGNAEAIKETLPDFWVPLLEKRRGKSKPFFVMYKEGRKMHEVDGVNTPLLREHVKDLCTVKIPASEFITQPKLLEFWEENFNPEESEVALDKFMRVMTVVCRLAVSLTEEEKGVLYEALGIKKESKEKIITAENLQKWIGEDETRTVPQAFGETLPDYEVRAAQARAEREAEEKKRQEQLRKEREEAERKAAEEAAAIEAERKKKEEEAIALSFKTYTIPTKESLDTESTPNDAVHRLDDECMVHAMPLCKNKFNIVRPGDADDNAGTWKFIQDVVADGSQTSTRRIKSTPFVPLGEAADQCNALCEEVERVYSAVPENDNNNEGANCLSLISYLVAQGKISAPSCFTFLQRLACAGVAASDKVGGADAKASVVHSLAKLLATSNAEDSGKFFGLDLPFVDFAGAVQTGPGGILNSSPEHAALAAHLLFGCLEQCESSKTFYAVLKPDAVPDASVEIVLPALTILATSPPEVPENRVCVAVQGITSMIDLGLRNGQGIAASGWYFKGAVNPNDTSTGFTTFQAVADQELLNDDKRAELIKTVERLRCDDDTFLRAFHFMAQVRQIRREYASKVTDPFWAKFNERLPYKPKDAVRELFLSMDGDSSGGLNINEIVDGISRALEIPRGDDITPAVYQAFHAVKEVRAKAGKAVTETDRINLHELSLTIQYVRMFYELLAMFQTINSSRDRSISPDELQKSSEQLKEWGTEIDESTFENIDLNKNGKISFGEFSDWAIRQKLDLTEDDDAENAATAEASATAAAGGGVDEEL